MGGPCREINHIPLLHNRETRLLCGVQVLFDIPFLSARRKKKNMFVLCWLPVLISECDTANCILVHKQTDDKATESKSYVESAVGLVN